MEQLLLAVARQARGDLGQRVAGGLGKQRIAEMLYFREAERDRFELRAIDVCGGSMRSSTRR